MRRVNRFTLIENEKTIRVASYVYATTAGESPVGGVTPARGIDFAFLDQVLVSYQFVSSFKDDTGSAGATLRCVALTRSRSTRSRWSSR